MPDRALLPTADRLLELIDRMAGRQVLMLVDLVGDHFIHGTPKRISREAPVLILRHEGESFVPGGGANAVANVAALGGEPLTLGVVGDDAHGARLLATLDALGVTTEGILRQAGFRTPTKTRIVAGGRHAIKQQIVRYDTGDPLELSAAQRAALGERLGAWRGTASVAVMSDYGYGAVEPALLADLRASLAPPAVVLCDSRYRLPAFRGATGASPNEEEAESLLGRRLPEASGELVAAGRELLEALDSRFLLVTRGSHGMVLFEPGGAVRIPVHGTDQVADVTGAGDTVIGTLALATAAGATPLEASLLADYAGGVAVLKMGTATVGRDELEAAVRSDPAPLEEAAWVGS